jgi:hypothetical protein
MDLGNLPQQFDGEHLPPGIVENTDRIIGQVRVEVLGAALRTQPGVLRPTGRDAPHVILVERARVTCARPESPTLIDHLVGDLIASLQVLDIQRQNPSRRVIITAPQRAFFRRFLPNFARRPGTIRQQPRTIG